MFVLIGAAIGYVSLGSKFQAPIVVALVLASALASQAPWVGKHDTFTIGVWVAALVGAIIDAVLLAIGAGLAIWLVPRLKQ